MVFFDEDPMTKIPWRLRSTSVAICTFRLDLGFPWPIPCWIVEEWEDFHGISMVNNGE